MRFVIPNCNPTVLVDRWVVLKVPPLKAGYACVNCCKKPAAPVIQLSSLAVLSCRT